MPRRTVQTLAKVSQPQISQIIARPRLFRLIESEAERPALWISAPPGAGKTTLVVSYLAETRRRAIWYQVDSGDTDLASFFYYLGMACPRRNKGRQRPLPALTPEYLADPDGFARSFFREFFGRLESGSILVLDNYQEVAPQAPLHRCIGICIEELPPGMRLLAVSRGGPPEALARLVANRRLALVEWEQLKFTYEETRALANAGEQEASDEVIRALYDQSSGWAAGMVLMLERLRKSGRLNQFSSDNRQPVFDYFADLLFNQLSPENQAALLRCAFLPKISSDAAAEITSRQDAASLLEQLHRRHLFVERRETTPSSAVDSQTRSVTYEFHTLFREFLQNRAMTVFGPEQRSEFLRQAGRLSQRAGAVTQAAELFARASAWEDLARLIIVEAPALVGQGRYVTLDDWFKPLPLDYANHQPWLAFWKGASCLLRDLRESRQWLSHAYQQFLKSNDVIGQFFACSAVLDTLAAEQDNLELVDPWIPVMQRLLHEHEQAITPEIEARLISGGMAIMIRAAGHPLVHQLFERSKRLAQETDDPDQCIRAACFAILFLCWRARFPEARQLCATVNTRIRGHVVSPAWRAFWRMWEAVSVFYAGEFQRAIDLSEDGLRIGRESGVRIWDFFHYLLGSHAAMSLGDMALAEQYLGKIEASINPNQRLHMALFAFDKSTFAFLNGSYTEALHQAEYALELHRKIGAPYHEAVVRTAAAQALTQINRYEEAKAHLQLVMAWSDAMDCEDSWLQVPAYVTQADLALRESNFGLALQGSRTLFAAMRKSEVFGSHPVWSPTIMARLCAFALENDIEPEFVSRLIVVRGLRPPSVSVTRWPWSICVRMFGGLLVEKQGQPLGLTDKSQKRPLDVLKTLVAFGGEEVDARVVVDVVWPNPDTEDTEAALHTTLHRLRKLLGAEDTIRMARGRLSINRQLVWADVLALEDMGTPKELDTRTVEQVERVLALYSGDLLGQGELHPLMAARRERCKARVRNLAALLGNHYETTKKHHDAIRLYARMTEVDNLAEQHYQRLMACHYELGQFAEGIHVYRRCRDVLSLVLNARVSEGTEALHQCLRARMG